jgi:peroxiredoxin
MDSIIKPNQPAPLFQLVDLNGSVHSLLDYRRRIVVIQFWSAECPWVARVDQEIQPLLVEWGARVILLPIAVNANETKELIRETAITRGLPVVLLDTNASVADAYGAQITPHFYVIDAAGLVRYQGAFDDVTFRQRTSTRNYLASTVQALLAGEQPNPMETPAFGCAIVRFWA